MSSLQISSHILEPSQECPYAVTAKCYWSSKRYSPYAREGLTLVAAHAAGMHKECWEPVIEGLFAALDKFDKVTIKEVWCIDAPNHGEAALVNEEFLKTTWLEEFPWDEYGRAIGYFLNAGPERGARVDFSKRKLCALGHSMGATALIWLQQSSIPVHFDQMILCEPAMSTPGYSVFPRGSFAIPACYQRRDVWPSRQAALKEFSSGGRYALWDRRAIDLYVKYALRDHPASKIDPAPWKGISLCCDRFHEAACFRGGMPLMATMSPRLAEISQDTPVSMIFGVIEDIVESAVKQAIIDPSISDISFTSVYWVEKAGHLVLQNSPDGTAQAIVNILLPETSATLEIQSRL